MQKLLENEDATSSLVAATRGERAALHKVFEGVERGEISVEGLEGLAHGGSQSDRLKSTLISLWRMDTREDHALFLSLISRCIKDAQLPMHEQAARYEKEFDQEVRALPRSAMITRWLLPAVSKVSEALRREHAFCYPLHDCRPRRRTLPPRKGESLVR